MGYPLVSIIIPAFNAKNWICETVDSALEQTYPSIEVIVVNDGSTDGSGALLNDKYGNRIQCISQKNCGAAGARNTGIMNARGKYIQFLDADDILLPEKVAIHVRCLEENPDYRIAYSDFQYLIDSQPTIRQESPPNFKAKYQSGDLWKSFLDGNFIVTHAILARRSDIITSGMFNKHLKSACEDYDLWLRMAYRGYKFLYTDKVLVLYRIRPNSVTCNRINHVNGTIYVLKRLMKSVAFHDEQEICICRKYISSLHKLIATDLLKKNNRYRAIYHYLMAIKCTPVDSRVIWREMTIAVKRARKSARNRR